MPRSGILNWFNHYTPSPWSTVGAMLQPWKLGLSAILAALSLVGCDKPAPKPEPAKETPAAKTAEPAAPATPAPEPAKAEAKPKKKLEDCPKGATVSFDDKALEHEIRKKLQKEHGDVSKAELKRLKSVNLSLAKLDQLDVCVFTHLTGLKELFLGPGQIDDLSPIAGATQLESLRASLNPIKDVTPLGKLKKLDRLDLGRTQVEDLTPLSGLTTLTELQLDDTQVADVAPLAKLTLLERLSLQRTQVKDLSALKDLKKLKFVYVKGAPVADEPVLFAPLRANGAKVVAD